jgi:hypothetical protein
MARFPVHAPSQSALQVARISEHTSAERATEVARFPAHAPTQRATEVARFSEHTSAEKANEVARFPAHSLAQRALMWLDFRHILLLSRHLGWG